MWWLLVMLWFHFFLELESELISEPKRRNWNHMELVQKWNQFQGWNRFEGWNWFNKWNRFQYLYKSYICPFLKQTYENQLIIGACDIILIKILQNFSLGLLLFLFGEPIASMEQIPALDPNLAVESIHALEPIPFWNWFQELLELELELES